MNVKLFAIKEIERLMVPVLDEDQLEKLHAVLSHCLLEAEDLVAKRKRFGSNAQTIEAFLAAKSIEGCSSRTIRYYSTTLEAFAAGVSKPFVEVTTDDVRGYLTACQRGGRVSNVTVDNIRRIISSLFSWLENEDVVQEPRTAHQADTHPQEREADDLRRVGRAAARRLQQPARPGHG